ncbi:c-type cytochrome [Reinekea forsetii]|nr:c-type cytochrome [Reinekea forsetii]
MIGKLKQASILFLAMVMLAACNKETPTAPSVISVDLTPKPVTQRWYTEQQLREGNKLFAENCASCHGVKAESIPNWKEVDDNGNYPPPPLDGSAHAWHHPLAVLDQVIAKGGAPVGGVMPAWESVLSFEQRLSVIASFQYYWSDDIYRMWLGREQSNREN